MQGGICRSLAAHYPVTEDMAMATVRSLHFAVLGFVTPVCVKKVRKSGGPKQTTSLLLDLTWLVEALVEIFVLAHHRNFVTWVFISCKTIDQSFNEFLPYIVCVVAGLLNRFDCRVWCVRRIFVLPAKNIDW